MGWVPASDPPQATLPLFIHYYGNKDTIYELDQIQAMPYLCQSLYGHGDTPPFWCQREWRQLPEWESAAPLPDDTAVSPNEVLAVPTTIADGFGRPMSTDMPMAAPGGAKMVQGDAAVHGGTEVLHVYSTGLNGSLPHDMCAEQSSATFHLRGAYGPSMSQMFADQSAPEAHLPRASLRSHAEYIEFCRCLLDDEGHQCWRDILEMLGVADPGSWIRYSARFATLPPLPAQLALPAPVWSMVSSTVLMYLQPALLSALAVLMNWPHSPITPSPSVMHLSGYSAGSYTAVALETDYRLLCRHFQQPCCEGTTTVGALGCPVRNLLALLASLLHASGTYLVLAQRALRITHVWEDKLCVWHPKYDTLKALITPPHGQSITPALLIQVLEAGEAKWLEKDSHNYAHLLRVAVPRNPAFLTVKATLKNLAAYDADFASPESLDELASYLLSWAATIAPFEMLSAEQLRMPAASDHGALQAAQALSCKQQGAVFTLATDGQSWFKTCVRVSPRMASATKKRYW